MNISDPFLVVSMLVAVALLRPTHPQSLQWHDSPVGSKCEGEKRDARSKNAWL